MFLSLFQEYNSSSAGTRSKTNSESRSKSGSESTQEDKLVVGKKNIIANDFENGVVSNLEGNVASGDFNAFMNGEIFENTLIKDAVAGLAGEGNISLYLSPRCGRLYYFVLEFATFVI